MAGVRGRSGGANKLRLEQLQARNGFRPGRHMHLFSTPRPADLEITAADRRRTLAGLSPEARRRAVALLDTYQGWDSAGLANLRNLVLSLERLDDLQRAAPVDAKAVHRELRACGLLQKLLNLEAAACR